VHGKAAVRPIILAGEMRAMVHSLLAGLLGCGLGMSSLAQQPAVPGAPNPSAAPERPRIGLVLSGGGARGAAHVGVLKALEELRIPIDAVAGTSMGAVVGGLYASGMSAGQIERELASVDWSDAFRDRPPRSQLNFRRKLEDRDYLVQLPLGFRDGRFQLPRGLIQGQKLTQLLRELTLPVSDIASFDQLPTAFRAVATDLETGEAVVLKDGDLAGALRASVSAPGIFAPVERDGRLLVDGGVADNLPIAVMREMQVDRLIVVDVGNPLASREQLDAVTSVANQMLAIMIRRESQKQLQLLQPQDVLITPDMPRVSSYDFRNLAKIMRHGESAADSSRAALSGLSLTPEAYERYVAARHHERELPMVRQVRADAASAEHARAVDNVFGALEGEPFDMPSLQQRMNRYYGQGLLETLDYRLVPVAGQADAADLEFSVRPNTWGPDYVRFGLRLQDDFRGNSTFDAALRLLFTDINAAGAELVWDMQVGANPRFGGELYLPFSPLRRWFLDPAALFEIRTVPEFNDDGDLLAELRVRSLRFGAALGYEIGQTAEIRAGLVRELGDSEVRVGAATSPPVDFSNNEFFTRYSYDSLDSVAFPTRGAAATLEWRRQVSGRSLDRVSDSINMDWRIVHSWGKNTAIAWASGGAMLDEQFADVRDYFTLGGFLNLSGMPADSVNGPHYGIARLVYYRKVGNGGAGFLNVPLYAGMSLEAGNTWDDYRQMSFADSRKDASVFFGLDTVLGPAWLAVGYDNSGRYALYLSLGRGF
jgi:NTE family protein